MVAERTQHLGRCLYFSLVAYGGVSLRYMRPQSILAWLLIISGLVFAVAELVRFIQYKKEAGK